MSSSKDMASGDQEKPPATTEPTFGSPLPYEIVLTCVALVSRLYHPILSLVSKNFRSLTSSPDLYRTRSLLNRTEKCLYVCLKFPTETNLRWFTLRRKPDTTQKKKTEESSGSNNNNVLVPVQILNSPPPVEWSNLVAVGHKLYAIKKEDDDDDDVFFLDCLTHTWVVETPSLRLTQTTGSYEFGTCCLIEKILYCYGSSGEFLWSNNSGSSTGLLDVWRKVEGLEELRKFTRFSNVNLVECGGKMVVFWDKYLPGPGGYKEQVIWCAEVSLEMRSNGEEVWGKVEWFDTVLTVPKSYKLAYAIAATL